MLVVFFWAALKLVHDLSNSPPWALSTSHRGHGLWFSAYRQQGLSREDKIPTASSAEL